MRTGNLMPLAKKYFKLFDTRIAAELYFKGFDYIEERLNNEQTAYAFENTDELHAALQDIWLRTGFSDIPYVEDDTITL